jgi:hypothetical protein
VGQEFCSHPTVLRWALMCGSQNLFLSVPPVLLGLLVELVYAHITKEAILPFQIIPFAWTQLEQEPDRICIAKGLYQRHVTSLPQGHVGTSDRKTRLQV